MRSVSMVVLSLFLVACDSGPDPEEATRPAPPVSEAVPSEPSGAETVPMLADGDRLPPVDEAPRDPSFLRFRERLVEIVRARDSERLLEIVDPKIRFTFGSGGGREDFIEHWKLEADGSGLWKELDEVLALGGSFQEPAAGKRFFAPYIYSEWPESVDGFEYLAVTCPDAVIREGREEDSKPIVRVDHHLLRIAPGQLAPPEEAAAPRGIVLPDGRSGWIAGECVRSPVDYRAAFEQKEGAWRMVFFVAGD